MNKQKLEKLKTQTDIHLAVVVFVVYLWCIIWVIGLKFNAEWVYEIREYMLKLPIASRVGNNWIPFYSVVTSVENGTYSFSLDHFLNVVVYIPMGVYLFVFFQKLPYKFNALVSLCIVAVSSLIFEIVQLFTGLGGCDGTDFACNFFGGVVGFLLVSVLKLKMTKNFTFAFNLTNAFCLVLSLPAGVYFLVNTILNAHLYAPIL